MEQISGVTAPLWLMYTTSYSDYQNIQKRKQTFVELRIESVVEHLDRFISSEVGFTTDEPSSITAFLLMNKNETYHTATSD